MSLDGRFVLQSKDAVAALAREHRVLLLGGLAVVAHGHSRTTRDVDLWLDPLSTSDEWAHVLGDFLKQHDLTPSRVDDELGRFLATGLDEIAGVVREQRFIRVLGSTEPIDIFREPRNLRPDEFEEAWRDSQLVGSGLRVLNAPTLFLTKLDTGREQDESDNRFLEKKIVADYSERLAVASIDEAQQLLEKFSTPDIAAAAMQRSPHASVRELGATLLREFAQEGNPYAEDLLKSI